MHTQCVMLCPCDALPMSLYVRDRRAVRLWEPTVSVILTDIPSVCPQWMSGTPWGRAAISQISRVKYCTSGHLWKMSGHLWKMRAVHLRNY